ncbi:glycosyltransferase family 39 protein [Amycolatopsis suaedae]|uniref:Glycosyltransferase family 39 protein n=2 Tax=Amycolatopsis suaedae TaxID=2510978 RepID=A0A4Q7J414_9PSEU|nr:glycosyltransferase family 39 protein [Amycolatopsis suaedae]
MGTRASALAPLAWGPVLLVVAAVAAPLLITLGGHGHDPDELYFIAAGAQLEWGYADQPPFVPLVAWLMDTWFPGSVYALRLPSLLAVLAGVIVAALLAREMGGHRRAQAMTAAVFGLAFLWYGGALQTDSFSILLWTVVSWLVVRWVRLRRDGASGTAADLPLLWAGVATAVALQMKFLIPVLWVALGIGVLIAGPRDLLRRPLLWAGAAFALFTTAPGLLWQAANGWPQLAMSEAVAAEQEILSGGRLLFLPHLLLVTGLVAGTVFFCFGLWKLLSSPDLRDYRFLGWTVLGVIALILIAGGRYTYVLGILPVTFAAAAVQLQLRPPARWWRWVPTWPVIALSAVLTFTQLPLAATTLFAAGQRDDLAMQDTAGEEYVWPAFADSVARALRELPPPERAATPVVTRYYWEAGALRVLGPRRDLPNPVYSPSRGFGYLGSPSDDTQLTLLVGWAPETARELFAEVIPLGEVGPAAGTELGRASLLLVAGPREPWSRMWPGLRTMAVLSS